MISTEPTARTGPTDRTDQQESGPRRGEDLLATASHGPDDPVTALRGAGVDVNVRRLVPYLVGVLLVALVVSIVGFAVAGAQKNDQVNQLRQHGVIVEATVSGCIGLMGGSGSNLAGYSCRASFTLAGHRYDEPLAGSPTPVRGSTFRAVTVPGDPALLATVAAVGAEQSSWRVYILPGVLLIVLVLILVVMLVARRRAKASRVVG